MVIFLANPHILYDNNELFVYGLAKRVGYDFFGCKLFLSAFQTGFNLIIELNTNLVVKSKRSEANKETSLFATSQLTRKPYLLPHIMRYISNKYEQNTFSLSHFS